MKNDFGDGDKPSIMLPSKIDHGELEKSGNIGYRAKLLEKYHGGEGGIAQRLKRNGADNLDGLLSLLLDELLSETDNLLGNEMMTMEAGDIRDSTVISHKRAEVIRDTIRLIQAKQQMAKETGFDVEGPHMRVIFLYFLRKVKDTFEKIDMPTEQNDLFFRTFNEAMDNWKKELKQEVESMRHSNG